MTFPYHVFIIILAGFWGIIYTFIIVNFHENYRRNSGNPEIPSEPAILIGAAAFVLIAIIICATTKVTWTPEPDESEPTL